MGAIQTGARSFKIRCAIWYHLRNLKNVKNTHGGLLLLVKLQFPRIKGIKNQFCRDRFQGKNDILFFNLLKYTFNQQRNNLEQNFLNLRLRNIFLNIAEAVVQRCSVKKVFLKNFAKFIGRHLVRVSFLIKCMLKGCNFIKKETLAQVYFCEFCKILRTAFLTEEHLRW